METVTVIVPTFGQGAIWHMIAGRACQSAVHQSVQPLQVIRSHQFDLAQARNEGAANAHGDWLVFLDATDELDYSYIEAMLDGVGDVRYPSTLGVVDGKEDDYPVLLEPKPNMLIGNHIVIGAMIRKELFWDVGGFRDLPVLEDWDLWIRCWLSGADIRPCPQAIYRVHVMPNSRNQQYEMHGRVYQEIQQAYGPLAAAKGLL